MAGTKFKIKQTSIPGRKPSTDPNSPAYIEQGEFAINVSDRILYSKDSGGDIFEVGASAASGVIPEQSASNSGMVLTTNGSTISWETPAAKQFTLDGGDSDDNGDATITFDLN
jgi:hypothetical protein